MIRSSALLTVAAMAMLVTGVFSASLGLIYASIAVSILAAITLGAGVLLRRRELFGAAADGEVRPGWAAADIAGTRSPGIRPDRIAAATTGPASAGQPAGRMSLRWVRARCISESRTGRCLASRSRA